MTICAAPGDSETVVLRARFFFFRRTPFFAAVRDADFVRRFAFRGVAMKKMML